MWLFDIIKSIWNKSRQPTIEETKDWQQVYLNHIQAYKDHIEFLEKSHKTVIDEIYKHKEKHPENGKELDQWLESEEIHYKERVRLTDENRVLREEIIFFKVDIRILQDKLDKAGIVYKKVI